MLKKTLFINGVERRVVVDPEVTLARVLRKQLFLTGTKVGSGGGECGTCTVILDGKAVKSCTVKMESVPGDAEIITIEGIGTKESLHPLQLAWMAHHAVECGFYAPGFIVSAKALLDQNADPTIGDVKDWFEKNGNICGCKDSEQPAAFVLDAAKLINGKISKEELMSGIGEPVPDAVAMVTGAYEFPADLGIKLSEGTLHIKLVRAQVSSANILSIDTAEADKMPGVVKVITYKDITGTNRIDGKPILNDKKIFQTSDAIAMVLAYAPALAEEAAAKVKVNLAELPAGAPAAKDQGNGSLEPDVGFAYLDEKGKLVIHSQCKDPSIRAIAEGIGVQPEKLAIARYSEGNAFGYNSGLNVEGLVGAAALAAGRPVYFEL